MSNSNLNWVQRPTRRSYSKQFKAEVVQQCQHPGASIAGIALGYGINANLVHRWIGQHKPAIPVMQPDTPAFVPVMIDAPAGPMPPSMPAAPPTIRVEVRRGEQAILVSWPLEDASSCASWLRDWLK